jgi:hypothetical protein
LQINRTQIQLRTESATLSNPTRHTPAGNIRSRKRDGSDLWQGSAEGECQECKHRQVVPQHHFLTVSFFASASTAVSIFIWCRTKTSHVPASSRDLVKCAIEQNRFFISLKAVSKSAFSANQPISPRSRRGTLLDGIRQFRQRPPSKNPNRVNETTP